MTTATKTIPYLVADNAHVTILRPLASSAYGSYNLNVPQDINLEDIHTFAAPGNELGYVASLVSGRRVGGLARRFVRADVSVTAKDERDKAWVSESNVDAVLREARDRVGGDFFLESAISDAGLGPWIPKVDFNVGDIANVEIWGRVVKLPVTRIEPIVSEEVVVGWQVHVGGQILSDSQALEERNAEIQRALIRDRRELAGIEAQVTKAVSDANDAKLTADAALAAATDADGVIRGHLDDARLAVEEGRAAAAAAVEDRKKAVGAYESARAALGEVERLLGESEDVLAKNQELRRQVEALHQQMGALRQSMERANAQFGALVGSASASTALALQYSDEARKAVDEASSLREKVVLLLDEAKAHVELGRGYVDSALSHAESARDANALAQAEADRARVLADEAQQTLVSVRGVKEQADDAALAAADRLTELQAEAEVVSQELSKIDAIQNDILAKHQEIVKKHGAVLDAHGEAIDLVAQGVKAAGASAASASMGAMWAQLTAEDAAKAADSALSASEKNSLAVENLRRADEKQDQAVRNLADSQKALAEAQKKLEKAGEKQQQINKDQADLNRKLEDAQKLLEEQQENLERSQKLSNQAIRAVGAAAGFAAQTGMHAADTADKANTAASRALDATDSLTKAQDEVLKAQAASDRAAEEAAKVAGEAEQIARDAKTTADNTAAVVEAKKAIDEKRDEGIKKAQDANTAAIHAQDLVIQGMPRMIHVDEGRASMWSGSEGTLNYGGDLANFYLSSNIGGGAINFEARGKWTGAVWVMAVTSSGDTDVKAAMITPSDRYFNMKPNGLGVRYKAATAWIFPDVKA